MRWSVPLARVAGIPIRVHVSFLLLLGWIAWLGWQFGGLSSSLWALALILCLFTCVVLHELGHSLVAIRFGAEVRSVTLLPIGGVASMKSIPVKPWQELLVSLAGPAVNVLIVLLLALVRGGFPSWTEMKSVPSTVPELADALIRANIVLAVFNLLPAFPMDGGRVMRSLLAMFLPYPRATAVAAALGQALAVGFILLGLTVNPFLVIIGLFVFLGAESEERTVRIRDMLRDVYAEDVMLADPVWLSPDDRLERCLELVCHHRQEDFVVGQDGRLEGVLPRKDWLAALHRDGPETSVGNCMRKRFVAIDARTPLARLYHDLRSLDQGAFPVMREGRLVGLVTAEDISRYLLVEELRKSAHHDGGEMTGPRHGPPQPFNVDLG